jgi:hypothetical protein
LAQLCRGLGLLSGRGRFLGLALRQPRRQSPGRRASSNAPAGCPKDLGAGVSHRGLTLTPATPSSYAEEEVGRGDEEGARGQSAREFRKPAVQGTSGELAAFARTASSVCSTGTDAVAGLHRAARRGRRPGRASTGRGPAGGRSPGAGRRPARSSSPPRAVGRRVAAGGRRAPGGRRSRGTAPSNTPPGAIAPAGRGSPGTSCHPPLLKCRNLPTSSRLW